MPQNNGGDSEQEHQPTHPEDIPIVADQPNPAPAGQVSSNNISDTDKESKSWADRWMVRLTASIAFFGLCSVVVTILQWQSMNGQIAEMKSGGEQTERMIILNTSQLRVAARNADSAADAAREAKRQVALTQQIFEAAERPYLGAINVEGTSDRIKDTI